MCPEFNTGKAVCLHIMEAHREKFEIEYTNVTQDFVVCKVCKFFINFAPSDSESARKKAEADHYLSHGLGFLFSLGLVRAGGEPRCCLCAEPLPSSSVLMRHLSLSHQDEVVRRCGEFDLRDLAVPGVGECCVCQAGDVTPRHLARHGPAVLANIGLLDVRASRKSKKYFCNVCHSVSKDLSTITEHFSSEHSRLYNFLTSKYRELSHGKSEPESHEECELCGLRLPSQEFDSHLYMSHYQAKVLTRLESYPLKCPYCDTQGEVLRPGLPDLIQHCIEKHQMVRTFYLEDIKSSRQSASQPPEKSMKTQAGSFESAFMKFVGSERETSHKPIIMEEEEETPTVTAPSPDPVNTNKGKVKNGFLESEACKICGKEFERTNSKGELKSKGRLAADVRQHYTCHFRDKLMAKYPNSFTGNPPYTCDKCGFESKSSSSSRHIKQIMLTHVAACKGELDQLIESSGWRQSASCLLCGVQLRDNGKNMHYLNHFKLELKQIKSSLQMKNSCLTCPFENCLKTFPVNVSENLSEINFLVHLGCDHNVFSKLIYKNLNKDKLAILTTRNDAENNDLSSFNRTFNFDKDYKNCTSVLNERLWAISASDCFVCGAKIKDLPRRTRVSHYQSHFTSLDQILNNCLCCFCGMRKQNRTDVMQHILQAHLPDRTDQHVKKMDGSLLCRYCTFKVDDAKHQEMFHHLTSEEMLLEVEILKHVSHSPAPSSASLTQPGKGPASSLATFITELERHPLCVKCNTVGQSLESLMNHLVRKHYTSQINSNLMENFNNFLVQEQNQKTVKCKLCGKTLLAKRPDVAYHWGVEHRKILQVYYQDWMDSEKGLNKGDILLEDSDEDLEMENGNYLNTLLGELDADSEETVEIKERENLFKIQRFLDKVRSSKKVFVQVGPCYQIDPRLPPCHECAKIQAGVASVGSGSCCCFEGFRKLKYLSNTRVKVCGYLDTKRDPKQTDIDIWAAEQVVEDMSQDLAIFIIGWVGDLLCNLVHEERLVRESYESSGREIIWRRAHQRVREMCDVCSTTIFNLHWTCGSCSIMVCPDCFQARQRGTRYRSVANLRRPYRTRKRLGRAERELDDTLWPLCTGGQTHSLDSLLLTQMSPGDVPQRTVESLHQIRRHFSLPSDCICCRPADVSHLEDKEQLSSDFSLESCVSCLFCPLSLRELSPECRALHLGFHLKDKILPGTSREQICPLCHLKLADDNSLLMHQVLVHGAVEKYLNGGFIKAEEDIQLNIRLEIDENQVCEICGCNLNTDKLGRRKHYIKHLEKLLQQELPLAPPYRCRDCGHVEISRRRLLVHVAVVHRKVDLCLETFLHAEEDTRPQEVGSDWPSLQFCLRCQESFEGQSLSVRRLHYVRHFREQLEDRINKQHDQLLLSDPPFKCPEPGCEFVSCEKFIFINHVGGKHKHVDPFILDLIPLDTKHEKPEPDSLYTKCAICDVKFDVDEQKKTIHHHYFDHLHQRKILSFPVLKLPLCCPFPKCSYKTENVKSLDKSRHEAQLVYHIGVHHDLFSKLAEGKAENIVFFKNSQKYLEDSHCRICRKDLSKYTKMKVRSHYYRHVKPLLSDWCAEGVQECPLCGHEVGGHTELLSLHLASRHGLVDHVVELVTTPLDYSQAACLVCHHQWREQDRISEVNLHYTSHFLSDLTAAHQLVPGPDGSVQCWLCEDIFPSLHLAVMHIGSQHGGFHKLIQKIIYNQDELQLDISEPIWYSITDDIIRSQCAVCGEEFMMENTSSQEEIKSLMGKHFDDHVGQTTLMAENQITKTLIGLYHSGGKSLTNFFLPLKKDYDDYWIEKKSVKAPGSILNGFIKHTSHEMSNTGPSDKRKCDLPDLQQVKKLRTGEAQSSGEPVNHLEHKTLQSFVDSLSLSSDDSDKSEDEDDSMLSLLRSFSDDVEVLAPQPRPRCEAGVDGLSPRHIQTKQESLLVSEASHSWLCDGSLLQLEDASSPHNMELFQQQWARGQPVLISNSNQFMDQKLWHPKAFCKDFGHLRTDLVNTLTGKTVPNQPLKWFWEGFENVSSRMKDSSGTPMLLKLKDWPAEDDIAKFIPRRYHDLVHDFPIQPYTLREGNCNLASYIPDYFLRPELGPKMYIAYGNALYSNKASTNLHLDMSDAVNLLVYVGIPSDTSYEENIKMVLEQIDEAGCDISMKNRVRSEGKLPGALWHIYHPGDTKKIRDLLTKVAIEKRKRLDPHDDPIHDQSTYLDAGLRRRLYEEYGVKGYPVIQCSGDTVFIPAGACHQVSVLVVSKVPSYRAILKVRNLHNCIKIAEDFVSPELTNNCLHLTQVRSEQYQRTDAQLVIRSSVT